MIRSFRQIARVMSTFRSGSMVNLKELFLSGVEAVKPKSLFQACNTAAFDIQSSLDQPQRYHVIGFGKAVLGMAVEVEKILGSRLIRGCISIPIGTTKRFDGYSDSCLSANTVIEVIECAPNNLPDENAVMAAKKIKQIAHSMTSEDVLCVLISGGGSALLCLPKDSITLEEKLRIIKSLSKAGAAIDEMNFVRIALSQVKGGQLALAAQKAYRVYSYVISDIVGNPIPLIASGPTVLQDGDDVNMKAKEILIKYMLWNDLPQSVQQIIAQPRSSDSKVTQSSNELFLLGSNELAVRRVVEQARDRGLKCIVLSKMVQGNVDAVSSMYVKLAGILYNYIIGAIPEDAMRSRTKTILSALPYGDVRPDEFVANVIEMKKGPLLIVGAGEPTVCVAGNGVGGRNQELALRFSYGLRSLGDVSDSVCFLSAGTDGIDGPTDVAGAIGGRFVADDYDLLNTGEDGTCFIERNDSYRFYETVGGGKYFIKTGHTGTNVMDIHLLLIEP